MDDSAGYGFPVSGSPVDIGLRQYLVKVYNYMAAGLAVTGAVAYLAAVTGFYAAIAQSFLFWIVMFAPLLLVFILAFRIEKMNLGAAQLAFWVYAGLVGLSLGGLFLVFTGASIALSFLISAAMFLGMSLYGHATKRDLTHIGSFLFMGLIGIVLAGLVNLFFASPGLQFAISIFGVIVFTGLTAWDTQRIKGLYLATDDQVVSGRNAILGALALYLDFLNLFLLILQLTGRRRE